MNSTDTKQYVREGDLVMMTLPFSEVCMHMKVAGKVMTILVLSDMAQLLDEKKRSFSGPITHGEAGIYAEHDGRLYVPMSDVKGYKRRPKATVILMVEGFRDGKRIQYAKDSQVEACVERFLKYNVSVESDECGRRYRVTFPLHGGSVLSDDSPMKRLVKLAREMHIPAVLED